MASAVKSVEWYERHPETKKWWLRRQRHSVRESEPPVRWVHAVEDKRLIDRLNNTEEWIETGKEPSGVKRAKIAAARRAARQRDGV